MPLENAVPRIDDRNYDSLIAEVRTRIARYTPEWTPVWTDVNDNDPGITLAQVFAWLAEMLAYRMNLVPELNYIKFLQLIGIELNAAEPAQAKSLFRAKRVRRSLRDRAGAHPADGRSSGRRTAHYF
jgi:hypothetical protein